MGGRSIALHYGTVCADCGQVPPPDPQDILITCAIVGFVIFLLTYTWP